MKMAEFLALSDDEKVKAMPDGVNCDEVTEDKGKCFYCGKEVNAGDFCFGCHQLACDSCSEPKHTCF